MPRHAAIGLPLGDEQLLARTSGAVWGLIGALALLAATWPAQGAGMRVAAMAALGVGAFAIAGALLRLEERRRTERLLELVALATVPYVGALAFAGGPDSAELLLPLVFAALLSAYFFPWRNSVLHLGVTVAVLGVYLLLAEGVDGSYVAGLSVGIASAWALALLWRHNRADREARIRAVYDVLDPETGLLSVRGLHQALDAELSRATRHAHPLALIYFEVAGAELSSAGSEKSRRVATTLARTVLNRIRTEDRAARLDRFKYAVLAPETGESGAAAIADDVSDQIRRRMLTLGYQAESFSVAVGWTECQYDEVPREELMRSADAALAASILGNEGIRFPADAGLLGSQTLTPVEGVF